jgi:hypothetical protein
MNCVGFPAIFILKLMKDGQLIQGLRLIEYEYGDRIAVTLPPGEYHLKVLPLWSPGYVRDYTTVATSKDILGITER